MLNDRLRIVKGKLVMDDGSSVKEYLKAWQQRVGIPDNTPVNLLEHDDLINLCIEASFCAIG